jgi:ABC-type multidrug transport system ATPase subunit
VHHTRDILYTAVARSPYSFLTVRETLELYAAGEGETRRALATLAVLGVYGAERRRVSELGPPALAALTLARAIARAPELLLVDDALDSLPGAQADRALSALIALSRRGSTVVVASDGRSPVERLPGQRLELVSGRASAIQPRASLSERRSTGAPAGASSPPSGAGTRSTMARSRAVLLKP